MIDLETANIIKRLSSELAEATAQVDKLTENNKDYWKWYEREKAAKEALQKELDLYTHKTDK